MATWEFDQQTRDRLKAEVGTIFKDAPTRVALVYPSPYRIGMSSLGFQQIYRVLNGRDDTVCERAFLPDDVTAYRQARTPLYTYESGRPVGDADVVALSVAYETEVVGVLECLDLSGLPLRAADRGDGWPLVVLGGPLTFSNPLPLAPFADVIVMGEGEELVDLVIEGWSRARSRQDFLAEVARLPGMYVPSLHGEVLPMVAQVRDDKLPAHAAIVTPHTELSNMFLVENARGCHRGCTFCVMRRTTNGGMRTVAPDDVLRVIPEHATRVGLVGAATTDHPDIIQILEAIVGAGREVGLSSLRADRLSPRFVELLAKGGARTLTVASDGSSVRMRRLARKGIKDEHLRRAAELVRRFDLRLLKLYMVIGYPEETMDDIEEMIDFVGELASICNVALGMSPLIAKKNTPLDGAPLEARTSLRRKIKRVHDGLGRVVDIRSTSVRWAEIEYALAQGGWDMANAAEAAWQGGGTHNAWKTAIREHRREPAALRRPPNDRIRRGAMLIEETSP